MTLRHKQIPPTIVVEIDKACAPPGVQIRDAAESALGGHTRKTAGLIAKEPVTLTSQGVHE